MMKSKVLLLLIATTLFSHCSQPNSTSSANIFSLNLFTLDRRPFSFQQIAVNKVSVIIFLQPECPFCNSYGKTLRKLDSAYSRKEISFIGVVSGKNYSEDEINEYVSKYHLTFPFLLDPEFSLKKELNATVTPEAFLLNNNGEILYRGMIDNWGYEIGKIRAHATEHYLTDAMNSYLQHKSITPDSTRPIGCYIE